MSIHPITVRAEHNVRGRQVMHLVPFHCHANALEPHDNSGGET